jgi:protein-L-isoaspartate(D-aspartate) O-methyltransferase
MVSAEISGRIKQAFLKVQRYHFMPEPYLDMADYDMPFQIGHGQTISQPTTVKRMMLWLAPSAGQTVLDVGSGSGWSTAILAYLVGSKGLVYGVERIPELKRFGENNCRKFGCDNVQFYLADKLLGLPEHAPYDRILVSAAAADEIPHELISQLAPCGKLVIPVKNSIFELQKSPQGDIAYCREHPGYVFVPLVVPDRLP